MSINNLFQNNNFPINGGVVESFELQLGGAFSPAIPTTIYMTKCGKIATIHFPDVFNLSQVNTTITSQNTLPANYIPHSGVYQYIWVYNNSLASPTTTQGGMCFIAQNGTIIISPDFYGNFAIGGKYAGTPTFSISYVTAN